MVVERYMLMNQAEQHGGDMMICLEIHLFYDFSLIDHRTLIP